jgi:hypothetical protein
MEQAFNSMERDFGSIVPYPGAITSNVSSMARNFGAMASRSGFEGQEFGRLTSETKDYIIKQWD